jgi:pimeloyl-ACP methyl ester carboxylesterase
MEEQVEFEKLLDQKSIETAECPRLSIARARPAMFGIKGKQIMSRLTMTPDFEDKNFFKPVTRYSINVISCLLALFLTFRAIGAQADWPHVVPSKDGTPISYEIYGAGEPTLVFVHGWSCDARYWRAQLPYFIKNHRVVMLDLAGHGHSGMTRSQYTMRAFGEDVRAVTEATGSRRVILIGHSMGGSVIAEAARIMPSRVIGLIGIDTLENIEYPLTREELKKMIAPLEKDFRVGSRQFVEEMISSQADPQLREWILSDMSAAPPAVALSAMNNMMSQYITGEAAKIFDEIRVPVITVNGDMWPVNYEANRRHILSFDAIVLKGADHFLMLNRPEQFNRSLEKAISEILRNTVK